MIEYIKDITRQFWQLARKVSKGTATDDERREFDYQMKAFACAVCLVGMVFCLVFCFIQEKLLNL